MRSVKNELSKMEHNLKQHWSAVLEYFVYTGIKLIGSLGCGGVFFSARIPLEH